MAENLQGLDAGESEIKSLLLQNRSALYYVQIQVSSHQKNTHNIPPDWRFPYRFHKPPYKYEASLIPLGAQPGR